MQPPTWALPITLRTLRQYWRKKKKKKRNYPRGNRTLNLRDWNPTRCHCAIESFTGDIGSTNGVFNCDATQYQKRGDTGIEPATSCTQSRNHTTRPIARHCTDIRVCFTGDKKGCTLGDSNPRPQRGAELESAALTNSAKGALLQAPFAVRCLYFSR